ncbi:Long-chain-fatty-acid--CoA ligase [Sphingobium chlorophenolicum L-1]|uniref:Long-chain-fatty-acid--CoA ligase n=1 Tax=Sphingobium chlorophenolicum L-1 TaxID=690566 RepID=F6F3V5_SPHCR|nr:fatty acyl-AMP ligase [Sphingobium chlorophenolicum]AEG51117.1 Long-chain-fatty-acid--CoA ligase [Sphingobium chlorophenolicum L-1]
MQIDFSRSIIDIVLDHENSVPDRPALIFDTGEGPQDSLSYAQTAARVRQIAGSLSARGLTGRRIALLFSAGTDFALALLACLAVGGVAVPLAPVGRRRARLQNILSMLGDIRPDGVMLDDSMAGLFGQELSAALPGTVSYLEFSGLAGEAHPFTPLRLEPDRLAVLQYTSGTTSNPKGVMITHGNIIANETMIKAAFGHDGDSHFVGWVPHYHDQGLFGNILQPLFLGSTCVITSPAAFINKPMSWLQLISRYRAHTSGGPNFGYDLCVDYATRRGMPELDLSSWRVAFNGAERVRPSTMDRFAECFADAGFDRRAFLPCYGLAESTLVTIAVPPWSEPVIRTYDSRALAAGRAEESDEGLDLACCGPAMAGGEARIVDPGTGEPLPDGAVGEIWLRGPHIAAGYIDNEAATQATFSGRLDEDGPFLRTGDLGFSTAEGFFIVSRLKDLIIVRGRNYAPSDVEHIWSEISGTVGQASAAAVEVEVEGVQHIVLIAEMKRDEARTLSSEALQETAGKLRAIAMERLELGITDLVMVPASAIPRTTSGKVQRKQAARILMEGELAILGMTGPLEQAFEPSRQTASASG